MASNTIATATTNSMSFDQRRHSRSYHYGWGQGCSSVYITFESSISSDDPPPRLRHGQVVLRLSVNYSVVDCPPAIADPTCELSFLLCDSWPQLLPDLKLPELSQTSFNIFARLGSVAHLPGHALDYFKNKMLDEVRDAALLAGFLGHHTMRVVFDVEIHIRVRFENYRVGVEEGGEEEEEWEDDKLEVGRGLTRADIDRLLMVNRLNDEEAVETCTICMEDIKRGSMAGRMPCDHIFHPDCITNWLQRKNLCPVCRHEVPKIIG